MPRLFWGNKASDHWNEADLEDWIRLGSFREKRRFLQAHPALVDERSIAYLEQAMAEYAQDAEMVEMLRAHRKVMADALQRGGDPRVAIEQVYVNHYGALALDLPAWLMRVVDQTTDPEGETPEDELLLATRAALERARPSETWSIHARSPICSCACSICCA